MIRRGEHDVRHRVPPFAHHGQIGQRVHRVIVGARERREQRAGRFVEKDAVITHARIVQRIDEFRPDLAMPALVLVA